jgi:hypothetical protein
MRIWLHKVNIIGNRLAYGDWETQVFNGVQEVSWGGHWSTDSRESANILSDDMRPGDIIVAQQTDLHKLIGTCEIVRLQPSKKPHNHGRRQGFELILKPVMMFHPPLSILKADRVGTILENSPAFTMGLGSWTELTPEEYHCIMRLVSGVGMRYFERIVV